MPLSKVLENTVMSRFAVRRMLRQVERQRWEGSSEEQSKIASAILNDPSMFSHFVNDLFDGAKVASGISLPENTEETAGSFLDAMLQLLNWIKENPEFILFIINLFGGM